MLDGVIVVIAAEMSSLVTQVRFDAIACMADSRTKACKSAPVYPTHNVATSNSTTSEAMGTPRGIGFADGGSGGDDGALDVVVVVVVVVVEVVVVVVDVVFVVVVDLGDLGDL